MVDGVTPTLTSVTNSLFANKLIPFDLSNEIHSITGLGDYKKASKLVHTLLILCKSKPDPDQYVVNICHTLIYQQQILTDVAISILQHLGQSLL